MVGSGLNVFAVWNYIIIKARHGTVEINPKLLAFKLGGSVEEVQDALAFLQRPDPESRSKIEEGRRIVREGEFQYRLVNWEHYDKIRNEADRREYNRLKQAEYRAVKTKTKFKKTAPSGREQRFVAAHANGDTEAADAIAAEGLADAIPSEQQQEEA
ncbi:MAG TPA: hypothetical protein VMQ76_04265 [Terracidiphilus sp.]|nr:hypothetical protein [Terracidiphilus sp.]